MTALVGRHGLVRQTFKPWSAYLRPGLHPGPLDSPLSARWLQANAALFSLVVSPVKPELRP